MRIRYLLFMLAFVLAVLGGYWLASTAVTGAAPRVTSRRGTQEPEKLRGDEPKPKSPTRQRMLTRHPDYDAMLSGALTDERVLVFKDPADLARFLDRMGNKVKLLDRLNALNALRVGFSDNGDLLALLDGTEEQALVFPVTSPSPAEGTVQPGAVAMGAHLLDWLGVNRDNSDWGKGVSIAVLDTGVTASSSFKTNISAINLVDLPADPASQNGHGTAVASLIVGDSSATPGVAPSASVLSIRIADDNGISDSFLLAKGIVAAADAGVQLINISFGSDGNSAVVRNAISYALDKGILIVAAAGNNGVNQVSYPAANTGVIAVGAVDALGNHLDFSNSGDAIALAAPGYGLNAAWTGDQAVSVTGTSFSTPIIVGSIAAIMTESGNKNLTPVQAYQLLTSYLNDGGAAGNDPQLGAGMPDIGRVLNGTTPGIYDAAVASTSLIPADTSNPYGQAEVLIQNRGTETLINTAVKVSVGGASVTTNITALAPNAVTTVRVPVSQTPEVYATTGLQVDARVVLSGGVTDAKPSNDHRIETYVPPVNTNP